MSSFVVRAAKPEDLGVILEIWKAGIENSLGGPPPDTIDYEAYFAARIQEQNEVFRFFLVENPEGRVVAWQSLMPFRSNPAVRGSMAEISAYTHPDTPGAATFKGVTEMFAHANRSPLLFMFAVIAVTNIPATKLALAFNMVRVGTIPETEKAPQQPELAMWLYTCRNAH